VKLDPRVKATAEDLRVQLVRSAAVAEDLGRTLAALQPVKGATATPTGTDVATAPPKGTPQPKATPRATPQAVAAASAREKTLTDLHERLGTLYGVLQETDAAPTAATLQAADDLHREVEAALAAPRR